MARSKNGFQKSAMADKFEFKPYFPGIPNPEWFGPTGPVELPPTPFPGIINPYFDVSALRAIDQEIGEIQEIYGSGFDLMF